MGYIDISKIHVQLPIYHGTDDAILQVAVGHITGSSLPVGGETSHCIISGHRGLPSAKLFTDIDKLVPGDTWTINVLDQTLTYEVDQIRVVLPTDLSDLQMESGKDYCTLVTCTPYGVNSHRLLVRGHRVANAQGNARVTADALQIEPVYVAPFIGGPILIILIIVLIVATRKRR
jgi:sortase A